MRRCVYLLCALACATQVVAATPPVTGTHLKAGGTVKTYTPEEVMRLADEVNNNCAKGLLAATYAEETGFGLDGRNYSWDEFRDEVIRRHSKEHFSCVHIAAQCGGFHEAQKLFRSVRSAQIEKFTWEPAVDAPRVDNNKLPECKK